MIDSVKRPPEPLIENAADYVDALTRPSSQEKVLNKKTIPGRRMRDKFREPIAISELIRKPE